MVMLGLVPVLLALIGWAHSMDLAEDAVGAAVAFQGLPPPAHSCAALGCGHHDAVCYCTPSCASYGDCCLDYRAACPPAPQAALQLSDINIVVTTDMHAWVEGRPHQPFLNATIADMTNMFATLKRVAALQGKDVFLFDNGDINDGTGLSASAPNHVDYLAPLLRTVPYDALNCGNHELYQRGDGHNDLCPISGLKTSGYIASWNHRYLTSNIVSAVTGEPMGASERPPAGSVLRQRPPCRMCDAVSPP
jgi:2',3'-cyclic-nucleotide 2'-phosphodiesterase (5'-nucleotidase family)